MNTILRSSSFAVLSLLLAFAGCGDDDPAGPSGDTTAPFVLSIEPRLDDSNVAVDADIVVTFNEDMDQTSATGEVTLSNGTVSALTWDTASILRIAHNGWAEGVRVEVTLGTGIKDVAGNGLAAAYSSGFWTQSTELILLATNPADGATNVVRNTTVALLFSEAMIISSLESATTVDDGTLDRAPVSFDMSPGADDWVIMSFPEALPALAEITVNISTSAMSQSSTTLAEATSFSFTTGSSLDTTPPELLSITPANGSTISPNTAAIVMTFSEPIDDDRFDPSRIGAQFLFLLELAGIQPVWSQGRTVLTLPLPTPLPNGLPIDVRFATFYDLAGNAAEEGFDYRVTVSGPADHWPFIDGTVFAFFGVAEDDGGFPSSYVYWQRQELQSGNTFHLARYDDEELLQPEGWEVLQRLSSQVNFLGFREIDDGVSFDVDFDPVVIYQKFPMMVQSWAGSTEATLPDTTVTIDYSIEVIGQEDVPTRISAIRRETAFAPRGIVEPFAYWNDCWKTVLTYEMRSGETTFQAGVDSIWYAPTIGVVRSVSREEDFAEPNVRLSEEDLIWIEYQGTIQR